jgi:hypothetical protein
MASGTAFLSLAEERPTPPIGLHPQPSKSANPSTPDMSGTPIGHSDMSGTPTAT